MRAILSSPTPAHRSGHHGEVVGRDGNRATVDLADAGDHAVGREEAITEAGVHVVGEHAVLDPGAGIEQQVEAFAHGQLAHRALALDELGPAHAERTVPARFQVADERSPVVLLIAHRPFHFGSRFSANAATPSAASSVCVVTVNMPWRYESAASASISSTR